MNMVTKKAQTQATAAASVAVKTPDEDAAEDDDHGHQAPQRLDGDLERLAERNGFSPFG